MVKLLRPLDHPIQYMEKIDGECIFHFADDMNPSYEVLGVNWQKGFAIVTFSDLSNEEFRDFFVPAV